MAHRNMNSNGNPYSSTEATQRLHGGREGTQNIRVSDAMREAAQMVADSGLNLNARALYSSRKLERDEDGLILW